VTDSPDSAALPEGIRPFAVAIAERYTVEREVGAGGMATVYLARDRKHNRQVAVKVLRPELAQALGGERFLREIEIAAGLHHPHILPLFDSGEAAGRLYYVMPYVEGESLRQKLAREGALPLDEVIRLLGEIAGALAKAHHAGVVHRDIKPENILLSDGHALVTDFGVARAVSAAGSSGMTTLGMAVGTPAYMSPEQAAADPNLDHRADIYALGLLAYEMLSGRTTFAGGTPQQVLAAQITRDPEPIELHRPETPEALADLVMQCLRKEPAERPQSMDAMLPVLAQSSSPGLASAGARRRPTHWLRWAVAAAVLVAVISVGVAVASRFGRSAADEPVVPVRSLAVLPFATLHGDSTDAYFGEGIAEEILHAVSRIQGLHVAGRTSSFRYAGGNVDLRQIGRDLGVARVLEGTVQRSGRRIRVTAQLVDASTGYGLWSERYDRELEDIFAVQDEIARSVAGALEVQLADVGTAASRTRDLGAHDAYLLGLSHLHRRDVTAAIEQFGRAIAADSSYADAHAALASAWALAPEYTAIPSDSAASAAESAARRALALDSTESRALAALGYIDKNYRWRYGDAERAYRAAIALDPNDATLRHWYGELLDLRGRYGDARAQYRQALALDPASPPAHVSIGGHFLVSLSGREGRDSAAAYIQRAAGLNRRNLQYPYFLGMIAVRSGDLSRARAHFRQAGATVGDSSLLMPLVDALADSTQVDRAMGMLRAWEAGGPLPDVLLARWYFDLGAPREALRILERGADRRAPYMTYLDYFGLEGLVGEMGYRDLRQRIGLRVSN
jgi:serine/threonine-protein kinase